MTLLIEALENYHPGTRLMVEWPLDITRKVCVSVWPEYARVPTPSNTIADQSENLPGIESEKMIELKVGNGWSIEKLGEET